MKIITHGGKAHFDDLMACAILIAHGMIWSDTPEWEIERRDPTAEELEYPKSDVFVVDVGGVYDPQRGLYDHHQLPRGSRDSAMTLVASNLGLPNGAFGEQYEPGDESFPTDSMASFLESVFPWFRVRAELDNRGPYATAGRVLNELVARRNENADVVPSDAWGAVSQFLGPFEDMVLDEFERNPVETATKLADMIVRKWDAYSHVAEAVRIDRPWWADGEFAIADFTAADPAKAEEVSGALTAKVNGVAIFHDNRGSGLTLLRLRDDPRIDFTKVKDDPEVAFAHSTGFIVKTKTKDLEKAWRLVEDAYAETGDLTE